MEISSVQQFFSDVLPKVANDPDKSAGMTAVYQFNIDGDDGGEWHMILNDGSGEVKEGEHDNPDCTISANSENWMKIVKGELNPQVAFMQQKIKVGGKMPLALKLSGFLKA